jgi:hypothetical protein
MHAASVHELKPRRSGVIGDGKDNIQFCDTHEMIIPFCENSSNPATTGPSAANRLQKL